MWSNEIYAVVIGETGSGKSTFINYVANYFQKGSLSRPCVAIPTTYQAANMNYAYNEHSVGDRTKSQTLDCQRYTFTLNGITFTFIDTPGVNDTGGFSQDSQNIEKVFSHIENISKLTALILILNGAVARITINIKNVLAIYRDRLPDAIYSNIIIVLTNCEEHTVNLNPGNIGLSEQCSLFYMQNSAFSSDPATWSSGAVRFLERHFDLSMKTMNQIIKTLLSLKPASTKLFKDMSDDRNKIKQQLHMARMTILDLQNMEDELVAFELSADIHAANAEKFRNFFREKKVVQNQRINTDYHNTTCMNCQSICHKNCSLKEVLVKGSTSLFQCSVMNQNGYCRQCPDRCSATKHFHGKYIIRKALVPVVEIVDSMQRRYLQARDGKHAADSKCNDLQTSKMALQSELQQQYKKVKESISNLQKTSKDSNITAILFHFIELLEKDASNLKSHSVADKSREFIANLKQLCLASEQSHDTQQTLRSQLSNNYTENKSSTGTKPRNDENLLASNETKVQDLSYHQSVDGCSSPETLHPPLQTQHKPQTIAKDSYNNDDDEFHDVYSNGSNRDNQELIDESKVSKGEEKLQLHQDIADERFNFKCNRENLAMLPLEKLLLLLNNDVDNSDQGDIKTELQHRCSGESIGFLTHKEQIVLCEQYVKYVHMKFTDLMRLSLQLIDEINEIIGGDPFKINLIALEKRLQLSAINLLIKKKD